MYRPHKAKPSFAFAQFVYSALFSPNFNEVAASEKLFAATSLKTSFSVIFQA